MGQNIKGIKIEIGAETTQFNKALKSMKAETNSVQKELNAVDKALKLDPKNVDLIKQKEELLGKQVENTKVKIEKLRAAKDKADKEMANGTEINQEQYRILVREISATEGQLKSLIKQSNKFGNSAKELGGSLESIGTKGMAVSGTIIGIGTAAVGAMSAAAEETREYREDMNKLETAFKSGGFTVDAAKKSYEDFFVLLGETDRSVEAVNHLAELTNNEKELVQWSNIAAGVTAKFGDSLPIEGLTEAANETAKVAKVTGPLADALNWVSAESNVFSEALGGNDKALKAFNKAIKDGEMVEDAFSAALAKMSTEQERSTAITSTLNGIYEESGTIYKELNADIIANRRETSKANDQMAELGESSEGVNTALKKAKNTISAAVLPTIGNLAEKIGDLDENQIKVIAGIGAATVAIPALITGTGKMITAIGTISKAYKAMAASATAASVASKAIPYVAVATGAIALVAAISKVAKATDEETKEVNELHKANMQRYEDYKKTKQAAQEQAEASLSEISYVENLKDELMDLADETGRVEDSERSRAQFILNQLNSALGTEYTLTNNQIDAYGNLCDSIDELITKKKAEILLSSMEGSYKTAVENIEKQAKSVRQLSEELENAEKTYEEYAKKIENSTATGRQKDLQQGLLAGYKEAVEMAREKLEEASKVHGEFVSDMQAYESAYTSILEDGGKAFTASWEERTTVLTREQKELATAYESSLVDLADYAEKYKQGVSGYTAEGLEELKAHTLELKTEAEKIGVSINEGMVVGLEDTEEVKSAVSRLCDLIPQWAKDFLGINSPAKAAIPIGEAIPQGIAVGIKKDMSAEEALEKKCKNLENILKKYTDIHSLNMKLAESDFEMWKLENPEADDDEIAAKEKEMLNKKLSEQEQVIQDVNDALWEQNQLTKEDSYESQKLVLQLKEAKIAYLELADAIARVNDEKSGGGSGYSGGGSRNKAADYTAYHVQYGAVLKSYGYTQEQVDAAARKVSGYKGEQTVNINYNISGVKADTAYKVVQETEKTANNLAMQGVL